jgi:NAD(P)-dependent dehydrogenase (short-subunit alcohol dehydrogenase family)
MRIPAIKFAHFFLTGLGMRGSVPAAATPRRGESTTVLDLKQKVVLLTGAASGIGAETARILGEAGAQVVGHYRAESERQGAENALSKVPAERKLLVEGDFADPATPDRVWEQAVGWKQRIDVLVLNAATLVWGGLDDSEELWQASWMPQMQINAIAPAQLMRAAVKHYQSRGGGIIITLASWNAHRGATNPAQIAYTASKAAVKSAAQTIARGYAKDKVLSYVISPGVVRTRMSIEFAEAQGGEDKVTANLAMGEWVPPEEIGYLVAFLATGKVRHLTGATLDVNGASYVR